MKAIRHYIFIFVVLILIGIFIGLTQAIWSAVALIVAIGINQFTHVIGALGDKSRSEWTLRLVLIFTILSLVLALASIIVIFLWYGWIPALGLAVMFFGYFALREDRHEKRKREVELVRTILVENLAKEAAGQITQQQLEERSTLALQQSLPEEAYNLDFIYEPLLDQKKMNSNQYRAYLMLLERYLSKVEKRHILFSKLHLEVRSRLGLPRQLNSN